ncbi:MAG: hypothetical protein GY906_32570 [bacterium]|nr:hypothetical protein [bacterium]
MADQLNTAGFQIRTQSHSWPDLLEIINRKEAELVLIGENNNTMDGGSFFDTVVHSPAEDKGLGSYNFNHFSDPQVDSLIEQAGREMDASKRLVLLQEINRLIAQHCVLLPLAWRMELYGLRRDLKWAPRAYGTLSAYEMSRYR